MISKRVFIDAGNDNYARLAAYIADAGPSGEKCLMRWAEGMLGGDDYAEGIAEAVDVQARNTRAASKTYHLVISFRPEDEAKLTPEAFKTIEQHFAAALGYAEHQRHCGVHKNTGNLHMHVAYNMINPEKYTCHKKFRDFWIRDKVCRAAEREFGLTVDNGIEINPSEQPCQRRNEKASLVEAHTGQQSFDAYAREHREEILRSLDAAASWRDLHTALAERGMEIKPHGNGLVMKDRHSKRASDAIKASALERSLSRQKLEVRFGPYQPPQDLENIQERSRYSAAPLHRSPERGQLFTEYQAGIAARKERLQTVKEQEDATLAAIRGDEADLIVGTHAILSEGVEFARLGLAVIDEQHRFGVRQRGMLAEKAVNPHLLVMSATPIPRTLGLLLYGDLDISILDELPPGRTPVKTRCITGKKRRDLYHFLDQEIDKGRQVYLVCPAIEDTPDGGLNAVKTYYEDIAKALLPDRRVGLMHGKLKPKEKAAVMEDFKAGRLDALVSTTVIEVGVDVPNASVMVIENAERYGLSALHQLRGRVGRGAAESWCFLVSDNTGEAVQKRLKFLCSTTDGFAVAQYDLETRGPGDFFGSRQHGLPTLQIADLMNDTRTLHAAQSEALAMLAEDPLLQAPEHALLAAQVQQMFDKAGPMN